MNTIIKQLISQSPVVSEAYDTSTPPFEAYVNNVDTWYQEQTLPYEQLDKLVRQEKDLQQVIGFRIALKIAESQRILRHIRTPITVTLINPVYKETKRMQPRNKHPHGEDSIRYKIRVLQELEALNSNFTARFLVIDDECPNNSGQMAAQILQEYDQSHQTEKYSVLFLGDAINQSDPDLPPNLTHKDGPNRSVKGGAVLYGMRKVINDTVDGQHIIIDNDADLSIHPAQIGFLIQDILNGKARVVAASRREADSVALIGDSRNTRGNLFIRIWQHLLPTLAQKITDTNRAFKAFEAQALKQFLYNIQIYTFPYQIEVLQATISNNISLSKCGIAYVDSEAASTQQGSNITETYLDQIRQIIDISQRYKALNSQDALLNFFLTVSEKQWAEIENNPPQIIASLL
ncbi:MAG: hypothetical protein GY797_35180 [Deltaproteobacteria bacterium]|nr:hypothetical protein [Deltaproteobacteria bacterium]